MQNPEVDVGVLEGPLQDLQDLSQVRHLIRFVHSKNPIINNLGFEGSSWIFFSFRVVGAASCQPDHSVRKPLVAITSQ